VARTLLRGFTVGGVRLAIEAPPSLPWCWPEGPLERFASSAENLRRVLTRRVIRSARVHDVDPDEAARWIDEIVDRFSCSGLLDDRRYAEALATSLSRRGVAIRGIRARLMQKGVASDDIDYALTSLSDEAGDADLAAALALIRRRRLGPHRDPESRSDFRDKDLAALARAGFSYDLARRVIGAEDPDVLMSDGQD